MNTGGGSGVSESSMGREEQGRSGGGLKKGPWTAAEDAILTEYVVNHGEGNWNAVQKNSGLMRCGKSCRLRWANHLRPNLKKGAFTPDEERIIIELHARLGNKWARMAAQLPGRTDNEIKNYWNTRMKRRQRAGLPIYPQEVQDMAAAFQLQQEQQQEQRQQQQQPPPAPQPQQHKRPASSSISSLFSSSRPHRRAYNPSFSIIDPTSFSSSANHLQNQLTPSLYSNTNSQLKLYCDTNNTNKGGLALHLSSLSSYRSPSTLYNQTVPAHQMSIPFGSVNFETNNMSYSSLLMGPQAESFSFITPVNAEPPSFQTPPYSSTGASSNTSAGACVMASSSNANNDYEIDPKMPRDNSGLLDVLLQESHALSRDDKSKEISNQFAVAGKGKGMMHGEEEEHEGNELVESVLSIGGEATAETHCDDISSSPSSIAIKPSEEPIEDINAMDDDLSSLLSNFPSTMPLPEWYLGSHNLSSWSSSGVTASSNVQPEAQQNIPGTSDASMATPELDWALGSCYWNNMPGIC